MTERIILASGSPRRRELLAELGVRFEAIAPDVDEALAEGVPIPRAVTELAVRKARAVGSGAPDAVVIGADTVVVLDGEVLGKPCDPADAADMLRRLRGGWHEVITGLVVLAPGVVRGEAIVSRVKMRGYADEEIDAYVRSGDPLDKAGAYAIQSESFAPVEQVEGSWTNVMGLPLEAAYRLLVAAGVTVPVKPHDGRRGERRGG